MLFRSHKAKWRRIIRAARANNGYLTWPDGEDAVDEFGRLGAIDDETVKARAASWRRLIGAACVNGGWDLLTPTGQDIFMIRDRPHLRRRDVHRLWPPADWPGKSQQEDAATIGAKEKTQPPSATSAHVEIVLRKDVLRQEVKHAVIALYSDGYKGGAIEDLRTKISKPPYSVSASPSTIKRALIDLETERVPVRRAKDKRH